MVTKSSISKKRSSTNMKIMNLDVETTMTYLTMCSIVYNIVVLIYILNLENEDCNCFQDWRHDFMKYYSFGLIIWGMFSLSFNFNKSKNEIVNVVKNISMIAYFINMWCLYSYVGILDYTKCKCALQNTKKTHYFLYLFRYLMVGFIFFVLFGVIIKSLDKLL